MKFTDENKEVKEFSDNNYFGYGVHKVHIGAIELGETDAGKEYVEITVLGDEEQEDTARVWFTTDNAANYSFNTLRQIAVHNAKEADKDAMRDACDGVADTTELVALLNDKVVGGECWFTKYVDPSRTYQAQDGSTRQSVNKNVMGYEPKLKPELLPKQDEMTKPATTADDLLGGTPATGDAAANVPKSWA